MGLYRGSNGSIHQSVEEISMRTPKYIVNLVRPNPPEPYILVKQRDQCCRECGGDLTLTRQEALDLAVELVYKVAGDLIKGMDVMPGCEPRIQWNLGSIFLEAYANRFVGRGKEGKSDEKTNHG